MKFRNLQLINCSIFEKVIYENESNDMVEANASGSSGSPKEADVEEMDTKPTQPTDLSDDSGGKE